MELDFDMEKVKRFTLAVLSETTEDELSTVTLPILREKVAELMEVPLEKILGKEIKSIILAAFKDFLLSKREVLVSEDVLEEPNEAEVAKPDKSRAKAKKDKVTCNKSQTQVKVKSETDVGIIKSSSESKLKPVKPAVSAKSAQIERLKSYVFKCGVRKVWKKEFDGLNDNQCIAKLQTILKELGIKGKPNLDQCKAIKKRREFEAELIEINTSNIIDGKRRGLRDKGNDIGVFAADKKEKDTNKLKKNTVIQSDTEDDEDEDVMVHLKAFGDSESD